MLNGSKTLSRIHRGDLSWGLAVSLALHGTLLFFLAASALSYAAYEPQVLVVDLWEEGGGGSGASAQNGSAPSGPVAQAEQSEPASSKPREEKSTGAKAQPAPKTADTAALPRKESKAIVALNSDKTPESAETNSPDSEMAQTQGAGAADAYNRGIFGPGTGGGTGGGIGLGDGVSSGSGRGYQAVILSWINRHKKYPARARLLGLQGDGRLRVRINHEGKVIDYSIEQSSGSGLLDDGMITILMNANPFPPIPGNNTALDLEFVIPISFRLN